MSVEIEVGLYSLMHTGMLGKLNQEQTFDDKKVALLVYNDARDVHYIIQKSDGSKQTITPNPGDENCVVIMRRPTHGVPVNDVGPKRLFCHTVASPKQTWPKKTFECMNAKDGDKFGNLDTAFVLLDDGYTWVNKPNQKHLHTTFKTTGAFEIVHLCRSSGPPVETFTDVQEVTIKRVGGSAQKCCPTGDPP